MTGLLPGYCWLFPPAPFTSAEKLAEDLNASVPKMPSESASEGLAPKVTGWLRYFTSFVYTPTVETSAVRTNPK